MENVRLEGDVLTAELGSQLYRATVSSHYYLDEQVHAPKRILLKMCMQAFGVSALWPNRALTIQHSTQLN